MASIESKSFDSPDEKQTPEKTAIDIVHLGGARVSRRVLEPGWRWSECVGPVAGTNACQLRHVGVAVSGRLRVQHEDGTVGEAGPGDAYLIEPGHDGWVVGDEPFVGYEFET